MTGRGFLRGIDCTCWLGGKKPCRKLITMINFAIPHWDWTGSKTQCDPAIYSEELLGATNQVDGTVKGKYFDNMLRIICGEHHSEESRSFGSDPHSDQCIIIHVVIMDCVLFVGSKVLSLQGPPVK